MNTGGLSFTGVTVTVTVCTVANAGVPLSVPVTSHHVLVVRVGVRRHLVVRGRLELQLAAHDLEFATGPPRPSG